MAPLPRRSLFGHPPGLTVLFMTNMWAEFSYFGLQAMLVYYMTQHLGFDQARSSLIYGLYGGAAFFSPFFGGIIADRWLGRRNSVIVGATLMMAGHFAMAFEALLFPALALVALGNGLFVPPLAVQVSSLYEEGDPRQAQAFSAYYMGINLGGFLSPLICGGLGELYGWHWGFGTAGVGMAVGLATYLSFGHLLPTDRLHAAQRAGVAPLRLTGGDWRNLRLLAGIIAIVVLFRISYEQSGNVIALWIDGQTDRHVTLFGSVVEVPATWFQSINPLIIIVLTPLLIGYWRRQEGRTGIRPNLLRRMSLGCFISALSMVVMVGAAVAQQGSGLTVSAGWVVAYFILLTIGELLVIPTGLTMIGALSPLQVASMAMGSWYLAKFAGSVLAGLMGTYWGVISATTFFGLGAASVMIAALMLLVLSRTVRTQPVSDKS